MRKRQADKETGRFIRELRKQVVEALARIRGPERVNMVQGPDGSILVVAGGAYLWRGVLPHGAVFAFVTDTPALDNPSLLDDLVDRVSSGEEGWAVVESWELVRGEE